MTPIRMYRAFKLEIHTHLCQVTVTFPIYQDLGRGDFQKQSIVVVSSCSFPLCFKVSMELSGSLQYFLVYDH